jgi:hypothetical protein
MWAFSGMIWEEHSRGILMQTFKHLAVYMGMCDTHSWCNYNVNPQLYPLLCTAADFGYLRVDGKKKKVEEHM